MGVMCSTSQCELRSTFPNLRVTNVIRIVTFYTLPPLESPTSSWMTRSQRSRRRDKGLLLVERMFGYGKHAYTPYTRMNTHAHAHTRTHAHTHAHTHTHRGTYVYMFVYDHQRIYLMLSVQTRGGLIIPTFNLPQKIVSSP